jgi:hypothetical protein
MLFDDGQAGVVVADGRCGVRLRVLGPPVRCWQPLLVEVRAGPFSGDILDNVYVGFQHFAIELAALYASLTGEASLGGEDKFCLKLVGDGRGGVRGVVTVDDRDLMIHLHFEMQFDQTYLPAIIEAIRREA